LPPPIWHPPDEPLDAAAAVPPSDAEGVDGPASAPALLLQTVTTKRSEFGGMHTIAQPPSPARTGPSQFVSHPHVQVEGQSESTLHCPVCWATQA
jgi:hypothetical protein